MKTYIILFLALASLAVAGCADTAYPNAGAQNNPGARADTGAQFGPNNGGTNQGPTGLESGAPPGGNSHLPGN